MDYFKKAIIRAFIILFFSGLLIRVEAQESEVTVVRKNSLYIESYLIRHSFSSGYFSLNYERFFGEAGNLCIRAGVYPDFSTTCSFPLTFTHILPARGMHHFEYGGGIVVRVEVYEGRTYKDIPAAIIPVMYRYGTSHGLFARAGANLFYSWPVLLSPSVSLGYRF